MKNKLQVGSKVSILRTDISALKHRKNRSGTVIHIDGSYISVRPNWCKWEVELYPNELQAK
jgi:hypothetical protein